MTIHIRPATVKDIPSIQQVGRAAWTQTYIPLVPEGYIEDGLANYWAHKSFVKSIEAPQTIIRVADSGKQIFGVVQMSVINPQRAYLWKLYLLPDIQRQGIGGQLFSSCLDLLPDGVCTVGTSIIAGNQQARSFYEKHGFTVGHTEEIEALRYRISFTRLEKQI